jgi:LysR family transcriptional regulator (chromosome initiation inhibitor)
VAVGDFCSEQRLLLDLVVEDQDVGLKRMRAGEVAACVCQRTTCDWARAMPLGAIRCRELASPAFITRHFPNGATAKAWVHAPAIVFGPDDLLQHRYLTGLGVEGGFAHHLCPSSEGFIRLAQTRFGWGLIPELQVQAELATGKLRELLPERPLHVTLYWHHWRNDGELLSALTQHVHHHAATWLVAAAR